MKKRTKKNHRQYKGPLNPHQVAEGINAASKNAKRLAEDARLLLQNKRFPSAAALAVLSIEESGKVSILRQLAVTRSDKERKSCWHQYRSHFNKSIMGGLIREMAQGMPLPVQFPGIVKEETEHARLLDQIKQRGFYTDCFGKGDWSEPERVIDVQMAFQLVETASSLAETKAVLPLEIELWVKHLAPAWGKSPEQMYEAMRKWYEEMEKHGLASTKK